MSVCRSGLTCQGADPGICRGEAPKQVVHVQNGQTTHYRITVDSGLNIGLVPG